MSWIESHQALLTHRKTLRAATKLSMSKYLLLGHLHALWWWGLDNADESGRLGETFPEELAEAAGVGPKKATAFVQALVSVKFLEETTDGYVFHNWQRYTWRYYQGKEKKDDASASGTFGNHKRWHLDRGIIAPDCELCIGANRGDVAPDIATQSLPTSPHPPPLPNQPNLTTGPTRIPKQALKTRLDLTLLEVAQLRALYPTVDINARWGEWVSWIEEEEGERMPRDKMTAFEGWLKKKAPVVEERRVLDVFAR